MPENCQLNFYVLKLAADTRVKQHVNFLTCVNNLLEQVKTKDKGAEICVKVGLNRASYCKKTLNRILCKMGCNYTGYFFTPLYKLARRQEYTANAGMHVHNFFANFVAIIGLKNGKIP